ncbi:HAD-like domain-containing protein [Pseudomassariella vexata]|uniref:HAD-like domain-containing protein n=1 Tax=Pseudomassariella vexata TaxID=1141098 RepID=A0A1Y2DQR4_9PEZI|nr:HAD-like domain-containing protein [Pseudomassariella vexata]ORY60985.1 HAD-like domain-containing protein [Pseudomassariella vexata]
MREKAVIVFDLYGTLLSTESIAHELSKLFGTDRAKSIAALWRRYQLEYTWRINSMGEYKNFSEITRSSLGHALAEHDLAISTEQANHLMKSYDSLHVFSEIPSALKVLGQNSHLVEAYVFSNGTEEMVSNSVKLSPDLGPHADIFKSLVTVDTLQVYKPDVGVYEHLLRAVGREGSKNRTWLVSADPFDVVGSKSAGLKSAWIDRAGKGWMDRLDEMLPPSIIAKGVDEAVKSIVAWEEKTVAAAAATAAES